jgi:cellulose synthase/poly-beta-1,6-N-acetylglucosamine synthase-like glycosyltransferase
VADRIQPVIVVGVPACDEQDLIAASIRSIQVAADALPDPSSVRIVVGCDACTDDTVAIVRDLGALDPRIDMIEGSWFSAGACRAAAIGSGLSRVLQAGIASTEVWLATTDGDTVVHADWLLQHVACWWAGDQAVAGIVDLLENGDPGVGEVFVRNYAIGNDGHGHVHGANLGVRADAYASVGGFPEMALAEDHALWRLLTEAGYRCRSSVALRVSTSARLRGRAPGGFADTLRRLVTQSVEPSAAVVVPA